jgi:hypothetical protein
LDTTNSIWYKATGLTSSDWAASSIQTLSATELALLDTALAGTVVNSKAAIYDGAGKLYRSSATPAAAGSTITDAQALTAEFNVVTGATGATGVKLPVAAADEEVVIINSNETYALLVYPVASSQINALGASNPFTIPAGASATFVGRSATLWWAASTMGVTAVAQTIVGAKSFTSAIGAGKDAVAGSVEIFPGTTARGKTTITASDNSGATTTNINTAAQTGARTYTIPDAGASAYFMQSTAQITLAEADVLDGATAGDVVASKALVADAYKAIRFGDWVTGGALGSAIVLSASLDHYGDGQVDVLGIYGESTADLTSAKSAKVGRFRHLVNCTTAAHEVYGAVGQVVLKSTTHTHLGAGLMGTFEGHTSGVVLNSSYTIGHAGVIARIGGHAAITATTPLAGFLAFNNGSGALVGAASKSIAFAASSLSASYPWTIGMYLPRGSIQQGIRIGDWAGSAALGNAIVFATATDTTDTSQLDIVSVYGESTADLTNAISAKVGRFRHVVNGITCNHETYGLVGQLVAKNVTYGHLHSGLMGTFEVNTAATVSAGDGLGCAGVAARIGGATITVGSTGVLAGFLSTQNATTVSITSGGVHAAFACRKVGSGVTWAEALHIEDALVAIRFKAADNGYAHGVKAATSTISTATSHIIKFMVGTTPVYVPGFANETCAA